MATVTVSSKYQIVIPKEVREALGIRPGDKIAVLNIGDAIELVPVKRTLKLRGVAKGRGIGSEVERDREDRI